MRSASLCSSILLPSNLRSVVLCYWFAKYSQTRTWLLGKSAQILKVYFKGNPLIVMFVIYAPSNVANDSDKAAFFSDLHESLQGATSLHCHHAWPRPQDDKPTSLLALSSWRWRSSSLLCFFTLFQLFKTLLKKLFVSLLNVLFTTGYLPG